MASPFPIAGSSSSYTHISDEKEYYAVGPSNLSPPPLLLRSPTVLQLAALTALPSGMVRHDVSKKSKPKAPHLVHDGQIVSKIYPVLGIRPFPKIGSLEQSITCTMDTVGTLVTTSTVASTYAAYQLSVSTLGGSSGFLNLFDQYKIEQIEVWVEPQNLQTTSGTMATCVDIDDSNVPTNFNQVADKQGSIIGNSASGRYHKWRPHMAVAAFSGAFTSYANEVSGWIDSASPSVQHYGLKIALPATVPVTPYQIIVRAVVSWRAPNIN